MQGSRQIYLLILILLLVKLIKRIADLKGAGFKQGNFWAEVVLVGRFEKVKDTDVKSDAPPEIIST